MIRTAVSVASLLLLAGCVSVGIDDALKDANDRASHFTQGNLGLARTQDQRDRRSELAAELLSKPLSQDDAARLALANSPALQALLADGWGELASGNQAGRMPNPVFSFERMTIGPELEIGRLISFGLVDVLLLPRRLSIAQSQTDQAKLQLTGMVVDQVTQVRQAWVRAVAAQQSLQYADQVNESAAASAELARRMQQVGNFSKLQRARQQVFYADAVTQLALARQSVTASREALVRALGLSDAQALSLQLPQRLPALPQAPREAAEVSASAAQQRLDVQLARAQLDQAGKSQGINLLPTFVDAELGLRHDTIFDNAQGNRANKRGFELDIALPIFDWGDARRDQLDARSLAALNRYEATARAATSQLRENYGAYRTAYDIARHYRDEVVPLRQAMAEENQLRYNGMLIGVFELLAEARDQVASVRSAIEAQQQFWLADAALSASVIGRPASRGAAAMPSPSTAAAPAGH